MPRILLISHHNLAREVFDTTKMIVGDVDKFDYLVLPYGKDMNEYYLEMESIIKKNEKYGTLIIADLFGGSPFMTAVKVVKEHWDIIDNEIVTGMNLPMILQIATEPENVSLEQLKVIALECGKSGVLDFKELYNQNK